jgi:hypothetical protein
LQGNILRGYRHRLVRQLILEVSDHALACAFLATAANGGSVDVPAITRAAEWSEKPKLCFNIGMTFEGLRALGLGKTRLASFPTEFRQGMTARATKLGDVATARQRIGPHPVTIRSAFISSRRATQTKMPTWMRWRRK